MFRICFALILLALGHLVFVPAHARAQDTIAGCKTDLVRSQLNSVLDANLVRLTGTREDPVQVNCDEMQLFATSIELFRQDGRLVASGDVVFVSGNSRIAAERMEYDTKAKTGTFFTASGTTVIREKADPNQHGSQEPNAFFWGRELRKVGPTTYEILGGGFTACVQPTPRWDVGSGKITLKLDDYALLRNAVFRVKGVPVMYLPVFYYPTEEDDRSTGFTMPIYGNETVKGHTISNQFFWAIGRSHDASFVHDWMSKAGQGYGAEYRYTLSPAARGEARVYTLSEREVTLEESTATRPARAGTRSYKVEGGLTQPLPLGLRAQAHANYFTSLQTQQRYHQDPYRATQRQRTFGANLTGNWAEYVLSARFDQSDYFDAQDTLTRLGSLPRINLSRGERAIGRTPIYFSANSEYVTVVRKRISEDAQIDDTGLTRFEFSPTIRVPFTKLPFLTVNSAATWRGTYWTESLDTTGKRVAEPIGRQFLDVSSRITGPVFNRIFDTPDNAFAVRWKHVIEPSMTVQRTTAVENYDRIPKIESGDYTFGGVTSFTYALSNRLYAKKESSREIANVTISQSYYTDQRAAQFDPNYETNFNAQAKTTTNFSPVALLARVSPTDRIQGQFRTEWDARVHAIRTLSANGGFSLGTWLESYAGWSMRRHIAELPDFTAASATHTINGSATMRLAQNRLGGTYSMDYDFKRDSFLQQRLLAYYNAQCCGVVVEWQTWSLFGVPGVSAQQDRRFNVSFSLAGIGTFSNFFGALSGQPQRR